MKYRVISYNEPLKDFDSEHEALIVYRAKVDKVKKERIKGETVPTCHIEKCHHDEKPPRPCEIIERYSKLTGVSYGNYNP